MGLLMDVCASWRSLYGTYEIGRDPLSNSYAQMGTLAARLICSTRKVAASKCCMQTIATDATSPSETIRRIDNKGETSMTALAMQTRRFVEKAAPKLQTVYRWFVGALDVLAEAKMRKAQNEINRCRRLLHHDHELTVKALPSRR
jgi:hypothetical protein